MHDMTARVLHDTIRKDLTSKENSCVCFKMSVRTQEGTEQKGFVLSLGCRWFFQVVLMDKSKSEDTPNIPDSTAQAFPRSVLGRSSVRSLFVTGKL